jgi:O-antigen ligase
MTVTELLPASPGGQPGPATIRSPGLRTRILVLLASTAVVAGAVVSGMSIGGQDKRLVVLPIAAVVAVALGVLALTRFASFVLLLLVLRSSIDLFKLSGSSAGNTATNTAVARGIDPSSIMALLFLLAAVLWLLAQYSHGRRMKGSALRTALLVFTASGAVSVIEAGSRQAAALETTRILSVAMMFIILEQLITSRAMLVRTITAAYASLVFPLLYTLWGLVLGTPASEVKGSFTRLTGPFSQSNTFARYLAFMIVFGVAVYPGLSKRLKLVMLGVLGLSSLFMVLTLTRGALIASVVAIIVIAVIQRRVALIAAFAASTLVALLLVPQLGARFTDLGASQQLPGGPETGNSLAWRLNYWTEVLPLANRDPVTGIGLNMTQYETDAAKQPHNDFIRAYVETGVVGLGAYLAMHFFLLRTGVVALGRAARGTFEHRVATGALGCAICFLLSSMAANVMSNVVSLWYLVTFVACAAYVARLDPSSAATPEGGRPGEERARAMVDRRP